MKSMWFKFWPDPIITWSYVSLSVINAHILIIEKCNPNDNVIVFYTLRVQDRYGLEV